MAGVARTVAEVVTQPERSVAVAVAMREGVLEVDEELEVALRAICGSRDRPLRICLRQQRKKIRVKQTSPQPHLHSPQSF